MRSDFIAMLDARITRFRFDIETLHLASSGSSGWPSNWRISEAGGRWEIPGIRNVTMASTRLFFGKNKVKKSINHRQMQCYVSLQPCAHAEQVPHHAQLNLWQCIIIIIEKYKFFFHTESRFETLTSVFLGVGRFSSWTLTPSPAIRTRSALPMAKLRTEFWPLWAVTNSPAPSRISDAYSVELHNTTRKRPKYWYKDPLLDLYFADFIQFSTP